jgi:hypothetical protein
MLLPKNSAWKYKTIGLLMFNFFIANSINAQPAISQTGFKFKDSQRFNVGTVYNLLVTETSQVDSGRCVGAIYFSNFQTYTRTYTEQASAHATFISSKTLPAPGLRVVIINLTPGIDQNPSPYTDREYDKVPASEGFRVNMGTNHSGRYLAAQEGKNNFSYEIKRNNTVIESGAFTATIFSETRSINRNAPSSSPSNQGSECQRIYDQQNDRDRKHH